MFYYNCFLLLFPLTKSKISEFLNQNKNRLVVFSGYAGFLPDRYGITEILLALSTKNLNHQIRIS